MTAASDLLQYTAAPHRASVQWPLTNGFAEHAKLGTRLEDPSKLWPVFSAPSSKHPYWNCLARMGNSKYVCGINGTVGVFSHQGDSSAGLVTNQTHRLNGVDRIVEVVSCGSDRNICLVRSANEDIRLVGFSSSTTNGLSELHLGEGKRMALGQTDSKQYALSTSTSVGVFDLTTCSPIFEYSHKNLLGGPLTFSNNDVVVYYGTGAHVSVLDTRARGESTRYFASPGFVSLASYTGVQNYSLVASDSNHIGTFSETANLVHLFDVRQNGKFVAEWALPGREFGGGLLNQSVVRHLQFFENGSQPVLVASAPVGSSAYLMSLDTAVETIYTVPISPQIEEFNRINFETVARRWASGKLSKERVVELHRSGDRFEFSLGISGAAVSAIVSLTSEGRLINCGVDPGVSESKIFRKFFAPTKEIECNIISRNRVDRVIGPVLAARSQEPPSIPARLLRSHNNLLPSEKFFAFAFCGLARLTACDKHFGSESAVVGSHLWTRCVSECGFRILRCRPRKIYLKKAVLKATTVEEVVTAIKAWSGKTVAPKDVLESFFEMQREAKRGKDSLFRWAVAEIYLSQNNVLESTIVVSLRNATLRKHLRMRVSTTMSSSDSESVASDIDRGSIPSSRPAGQPSRLVVSSVCSLDCDWLSLAQVQRMQSRWKNESKGRLTPRRHRRRRVIGQHYEDSTSRENSTIREPTENPTPLVSVHETVHPLSSVLRGRFFR